MAEPFGGKDKLKGAKVDFVTLLEAHLERAVGDARAAMAIAH